MSPKSYPQIVLLGDSITENSFRAGGYGSYLVDKYCGKADVLSRGMAGYNSRQLLYKLETDLHLAEESIALFVINIGTNDSSLDNVGQVNVREYKQNLVAIAAHIRSTYPSAGILFITPSIYDARAANKFHLDMGLSNQPPGWSNDNMRRYAEACAEVAVEEGLPFIDAHNLHRELIDGGVDASVLLPDGIHFSSKGYAPINKKLLDTITGAFPDINPDKLIEPFDWYFSYALGTKGGNDIEEVKKMKEEYSRLNEAGPTANLDVFMRDQYKRKMQRLWDLER